MFVDQFASGYWQSANVWSALVLKDLYAGTTDYIGTSLVRTESQSLSAYHQLMRLYLRMLSVTRLVNSPTSAGTNTTTTLYGGRPRRSTSTRPTEIPSPSDGLKPLGTMYPSIKSRAHQATASPSRGRRLARRSPLLAVFSGRRTLRMMLLTPLPPASS